MKKLKSFLESIAARALAIAPIVATFAGGVAGAAAATALTAGVGLGFACIMAGTYFGFVAGYAAIGRAPEKLTGLPKATFLKDVKTAALLPLQGAVEICRLMSPAFNRAARPKEAASAPAPAIPAPLQQPKP